MATTSNARNVMLASDSPRTLTVTLPSTYNTSGDHTGTWNTLGQTVHRNDQVTLSSTGALLNAGGGILSSLDDVGGNYLGNWDGLSELVHRNSQITLSSTGTLNNAGGGTITALPYSNTTGGPPTNADNTQTKLENASSLITMNSSTLFAAYGSGSAGVFIGDAGLFGRDTGGSTTFSITASSGAAIFAGDITGGADIDIDGQGRFNGSTSGGGFTGAVVANNGLNRDYGVIGLSDQISGVIGNGSSGAVGVTGQATNSSGVGVVCNNTAGGKALQISAGTFYTLSSALVERLYAERAETADSVLGSNVSGTVSSASFATNATNATNATTASNANSLGGTSASGWCRGIVCDVGTATAAGYGFSLLSLISGVETAVISSNNIRIRNVSDIRLKKEVVEEVLGMDFINRLRPVTFRMKKDPALRQHGFIAQEVEQVLGVEGDSLAHTHDDGVMGVDYMAMVGVLVKGMQELHDKIHRLEKQINDKEG